MMPTQASGRWSIVEPPLPTFPAEYRKIVVPDPGWCWAVFDYDAIEARIVAAETHDVEDLEAFEKDLDLHTLTAARMFHFPLPPNLTQAHHTSPECAAWRAEVKWGGKDDRRRYLAKTARYALFYAEDHRGMLQVKNLDKMGISQAEALRVGYEYLKSKPALVRTKKYWWNESWRTHRATTSFGRERILMGTHKDVRKEGWNHRIQGTATEILNQAIIAIDQAWPDDAVLAWQSHDSATVAFPLAVEWWPRIRDLVERTYDIAGHRVHFTASWYVTPPGGHRHDDRCTADKCFRPTPAQWFAPGPDGERARVGLRAV
jgi:DNA polymerase-1